MLSYTKGVGPLSKKPFQCELCKEFFTIGEVVISPAQITCIKCIYKLKEKKKQRDIVKQLEDQGVIPKQQICLKKDCKEREN